VAATFLPGLTLSARFYAEAVRPVLDEIAPGLPHAAARIGAGSDVLGFDTVRSTDHDWGPRLDLFLAPGDDRGPALAAALAHRLPPEFLGYPTRFAASGTTALGVMASGGGAHGILIDQAASWFAGRLGFDPADGVTLLDWLATPTQALREVVAGAVFHDGLDALAPRRAALAWYPDDVWRFVLAAQWRRIAQEEPFVGRAAEVGDEVGARVVAARLARDVLRLSLLLRRRYPPYSKWLGTDAAAGAPPGLLDALDRALGPAPREGLVEAYTIVVEQQNALGLTAPLDPSPRPFHDRPFAVIAADRCADALLAGVTDPAVRRLPLIGAIDQFVDSTDALGDVPRRRALAAAALELG
jgi:hypothetical protein